MTDPTFFQGIRRVLNSPKVHAAIVTLTPTWFAVHYAAADLTPNARAVLWTAFIGAVTVTLREIINSWAEENVATLQNQSPPPAPLNTEAQAPQPLPPTVHFTGAHAIETPTIPPRTILPK